MKNYLQCVASRLVAFTSYVYAAHVSRGSFSPIALSPVLEALRGPWDSGALSIYILFSNYGSAGMPPKSSITQRLWQSHVCKMRRLGFSPINTNLTIQSISILRKCFQLGKRFSLNGTKWIVCCSHWSWGVMSLHTNIAYFGREYNFSLKSLFAFTRRIATYIHSFKRL